VLRTGLGVLISAAAAAVVAVPGQASLYQPDEPTALSVAPDGRGEALDFNEFKRRMVMLTNQLNPALKDPADPTKDNPDRARLLKRIAAQEKVRKRTQFQTAALAADLLRAGQSDRAEGLLAGDRRGFLPNVTLSHVYASRGEWGKAAEYLSIANDYTDEAAPPELPKLTKDQVAWQVKLNKTYLRRLFDIRYDASRVKPRPPVEDETPDPLFPDGQPGGPSEPLRFVNDAGGYEPGALAAAERAKLPTDAIAVVQQLLLWLPTDARLYWLLAELYAADGDLDTAIRIMDELVSAREYGNRRQLMDHRAAVRAALDAKRKAEEQAAADAFPISMRTVWIYFAAVGGIAVLAFLRAFLRRKGGCGPVG
jgi:hypothetical protein